MRGVCMGGGGGGGEVRGIIARRYTSALHFILWRRGVAYIGRVLVSEILALMFGGKEKSTSYVRAAYYRNFRLK